MKKFIPLFTLAAASFFFTTAHAQCVVTGLAIQLKSSIPQNGGCEVTFDFSWNQEVNHGNKFAYVHLWNRAQYPDLLANGLAYTNPSDYPDTTDLANALATIVIDSNGNSPSIGTTYWPDPNVTPLNGGSLSIEKLFIDSSIERMILHNIKLVIPSCYGSGITGDIWSSQAKNGKNVHCVSPGVSVVVGNPRVTGLLYCQVPRLYSTQISNIGDSALFVSYNIFVDDGDGTYEPTLHDQKVTDTAVGPILLEPDSTYSSGPRSYAPWSSTKPYADHGLWVEVATGGTNFKTLYYISNGCAALPVVMGAFTAHREGAEVSLNWETLTEINNTGFGIQRRLGSASDFVTIAFVPTQAPAGMSQSSLRYRYVDDNPVNAVSQYRIRQIDMDGQFHYSEIRAVRGMNQADEVMVYPNPSYNGTINVLLGNGREVYDISLIDASGRQCRKWISCRTGTLLIGQLAPGMYSLEVINTATQAKTHKKIMILNQ